MNTDTAVQPSPSNTPPKPGLWQKMSSSKVLVISIVVHLIFAAGATYLIVQRVQLKRKMTFQGGPPAVNASKRALEHKMSLGKKKAVMSAPAQAKRIMATGLAKVARGAALSRREFLRVVAEAKMIGSRVLRRQRRQLRAIEIGGDHGARSCSSCVWRVRMIAS